MERAKNYIIKCLNDKTVSSRLSVDYLISSASKKRIKELLNREIRGFFLVANDIRHTYNRHSKASESDRNQIPLSIDDMIKIPDVISYPDNITKGNKNIKNGDSIKFEKMFSDATLIVVFVECYFTAEELQQKTGYKKKL